jgi:ABC-2 type transport system ATP-binding protein
VALATDLAISVTGLTRRFGARVAVQSLDLSVPAGTVYGFLGPNGSGKTTAIRCMLGLLRADAGKVSIFGESDPVRRLDGVGAIIETPRFYAWLSGRANLEICEAYLPEHRHGQIDEALERVGLASRAHDKVSGYSLGMQQRLGIARALLGRPRLLVLDEPTNGLDPQGMRDVRELIRRLAQEGMTVFISSHLLSEIQAVADTVGIVLKGRRVAEGRVSELLRASAGDSGAVEIELGGPDLDAIRREVATLDGVSLLPESDPSRVLVRSERLPASELNRALVSQGVALDALSVRAASLESLFLSLTESEEVQ